MTSSTSARRFCRHKSAGVVSAQISSFISIIGGRIEPVARISVLES